MGDNEISLSFIGVRDVSVSELYGWGWNKIGGVYVMSLFTKFGTLKSKKYEKVDVIYEIFSQFRKIKNFD